MEVAPHRDFSPIIANTLDPVTEQIDCCKVVQSVSKGGDALPGALDVGSRGLMNLHPIVFGMYFLLKNKWNNVKDTRLCRKNNSKKSSKII